MWEDRIMRGSHSVLIEAPLAQRRLDGGSMDADSEAHYSGSTAPCQPILE